ncbi:MAG: hypothetical protein NTZ44_02670 [Candidatus Nomurabacteria bacterium]|nr:hypothetical protein [Candidatus Nomurabacteria bacterium]
MFVTKEQCPGTIFVSMSGKELSALEKSQTLSSVMDVIKNDKKTDRINFQVSLLPDSPSIIKKKKESKNKILFFGCPMILEFNKINNEYCLTLNGDWAKEHLSPEGLDDMGIKEFQFNKKKISSIIFSVGEELETLN